LEENKISEDGFREIEDLLRQAGKGCLALCDGSMPYIIPMNFLYHERKIVFHSSFTGKKLDLIARNPNCCFQVDRYVVTPGCSDNGWDYDSVLAFGKACIGTSKKEKIRLLQLFAEKYDERYRKPVSQGGLKVGVTKQPNCNCIVIHIEELTGLRARTVDGRRQRTRWRRKF
jgi:nitroimidazol reductase NimA-like FMN-containing flavoprotein (pyridoxamine 5'-phosphate oxidase superfamily)